MADKSEIVSEFKRRFRIAQDAEKTNRETFREDRRFVYDDDAQWEGATRSAKRPKVTINRLQVFARNIVNEARESAVSIKVNPTDGLEGRDLAGVVSGMIRDVEARSNAATEVYPGAFEDSVTGGFGEVRVLVDYESPDSFQQVAKIARITDPLTVLRDPFYTDPTGADAKWLILHARISKQEFEAKYPKAEPIDAPVDDRAFWEDKSEGVLIAEYFEVIDDAEKIYQMPDGTVVWASAATPEQKAGATAERMSYRRRVMWSKLAGGGVIEGPTEFPSQYIPVVRMAGREWFEDGKRNTCGACHYAKDAQRIYNYGRTQQLERLAMAPKAPFVGYKGQFLDKKWNTANTEPWAYLEAEPVTIDGKPAPLPQRSQPVGVDPALSEEIAIASEEIKATTGIFDANLGAQSNEQSGRAILARQQQGSRANADFVANRNACVRQVGQILLDIFPRIYDTPRVVRIVGADDGQDMVWILKEFIGRDGKKHFYDLSKSKFDIVLDVGPSYATRRQETAVAMQETLRTMPIVGQVAPDLVIAAQDWPDSEKLAARLRNTPMVKASMTPQEIQESEQQDGAQPQQPQIPPELLQRMQELEAENEQLKQGAAIEAAKLEVEKYKTDADNATRVQVALIQAEKEVRKQNIATEAAKERAEEAAEAASESAQSPEAGEYGQGIAPESEAES